MEEKKDLDLLEMLKISHPKKKKKSKKEDKKKNKEEEFARPQMVSGSY